MAAAHEEINVRGQRQRRRLRIRKKVNGTTERPRLAVFRSHRHIYAQLIDDGRGHTLVQASSRDLGSGDSVKGVARCKEVGLLLAQRAREAGVEQAAFDRGGYRYHGRVRALAEGAREGGIRF